MHGQDILCGISKDPFEIPYKISHPYTERYGIIENWNFKNSWTEELESVFEMPPEERDIGSNAKSTWTVVLGIIYADGAKWPSSLMLGSFLILISWR